MVKIVEFKKELLTDWNYDGVERELFGGNVLPVVEFYNKMGSCFVGLVDDKVIGVGGLYPLWAGSGSCFLFINKEGYNYKKSVFKILLEYMNMLIAKYEINSLTVECQDEISQAHSLVKHLGFIKNKQLSMSVYIKSE